MEQAIKKAISYGWRALTMPEQILVARALSIIGKVVDEKGEKVK